MPILLKILKRYTILIVDWDFTIGNLSENLLYGLFKAKQQNKKLIFIRKILFFENFLKTRLKYKQPKGLYSLRHVNMLSAPNIFIKTVSFWYGIRLLLALGIGIFFRLVRLNPHFQLKLQGLGHHDIFNIKKEKEFNFNTLVEIQNNFHDFINHDLHFTLDPNTEQACEENMRKMGISDTDWYVCLHIRTNFFHKGNSDDDYRNSSIENYIQAIDYIKSLGGHVIRLGDSVKLMESPQYIDYPLTWYKSEIMDLYLINNCKFYFGTNSGILDTAYLLGKPTLAVNVSDFITVKPLQKHDIIIWKYVYSKEKERILTLEEIFNQPFYINPINYDLLCEFNAKYEFIENTSEDITEAVKEIMMNLDQGITASDKQKEFKKVLTAKTLEWIEKEAYFSNNVEESFRFAFKTFYEGYIGKNYLDKFFH